MQSSTIKKLSVSITLVGMLILLIISQLKISNITNIKDITSDNQDVSIVGHVTSIKQYDNMTIITLKQDTQINCIAFSNLANIELNDKVKITGSTNTYKNEYQIMVDTITHVN